MVVAGKEIYDSMCRFIFIICLLLFSLPQFQVGLSFRFYVGPFTFSKTKMSKLQALLVYAEGISSLLFWENPWRRLKREKNLKIESCAIQYT